jgi:hypothetical protein
MAQVNLVNKQVQMNLTEIIKFQLITHCYINKISLSELDFECLTYLGLMGESELTDFCNQIAERRLQDKLKTWTEARKPDSSPQTIRNVLIKVEKEKLILKSGRGRKKIMLNPSLKIQTGGNILLNYKLVHIES